MRRSRPGRLSEATQLVTEASRLSGRAGRLIRFVLVGISGLAVNQAALWFFTELFGIHYLISAVLATQCSTSWNFVLTEAWVYRASRVGRLKRFLGFALLNNAWLVVRAPILYFLTDILGIHYLVSNLMALAVATLSRFVIADTRIWRSATRGDGSPVITPAFGSAAARYGGARGGARGQSHAYNVHGLVRIRSEVRLPELHRFRVDDLAGSPDLEVVVDGRGLGGPRRRAAVSRNGDSLSYVEHLGSAGFGFTIEAGTPTRVRVTRLLRASPHVLYTNIVEPLLRWELVRKGCILAHAACLEIDGTGVLITAQTDTGKTTTCLRSVRERRAGFVSDDMTIIHPDGTARSYPKPLTISAHTLQAARASKLRWRTRAWLQVQGRLHSKSGRRVGLAMSSVNLPVCSLNALVQMIVPPPKFFVEELVPDAQIVDALPLSHMILIERGGELTEVLDAETACRILAENTEDAYGFPPYPLISDAIANGDGVVEEDIRRRVVERLAAVRLRTPDRSWYALLETVLSSNGHGSTAAVQVTEDAVQISATDVDQISENDLRISQAEVQISGAEVQVSETEVQVSGAVDDVIDVHVSETDVRVSQDGVVERSETETVEIHMDGVVSDGDGGVRISDDGVSVADGDGGVRVSAISDGDGEIRISQISDGDGEIRISRDGQPSK